MKKEQYTPWVKPYLEKSDAFLMKDGTCILRGEEIKIRNIHGTKFRFDAFVRNTLTGQEWIDCYELEGGKARAARAFPLHVIIPIKKVKRRGPRT